MLLHTYSLRWREIELEKKKKELEYIAPVIMGKEENLS